MTLPPLPYVPFGAELDAVPHVFVDGLRTPRTVLELSHWPGNRTPAALKGDVSTQAALALLRSDAVTRERLVAGAAAVTCDHYDVDGLLSVWTLVRPDAALDHRDLVGRTALCGDFDVHAGDDAVRACLALLAAEREVHALAAGECRSVEATTAALFDGMLERADECLLNPDAWRADWDAEWEHIAVSLRYLETHPSAVTEYPELDLAVVADTAEPLHDYVVNACTRICHVLRLSPDGRHRMNFRYESFVDLQTFTPPPRVDGGLLAELLNEKERRGTWFCESPATATPLLQLYSDDRVPGASSWAGPELARTVIEFFARARSDPSSLWSPHAGWIHEAAGTPPSKETA